MKKLFLALLAVSAVSLSSTASAQIYRPSTVGSTTVLGAVTGALIGGHNHDRWAEGAIIGAAAGAIVGAVVDDTRAQQQVVYSQPGFAPVATVADAPVIGAPAPQVVYTTPAPQVVYATSAPQQVVYVNSAPRVVYVNSCPPPVVVARPVVYISGGWSYGHGYYGHGHRGHRRW